MIKLLDLITEKGPCWKGYKQIGMKDKDGRQVPNCVPINEDTTEGEDIKCKGCGWEWNTENSETFDKYICHKCGYDNTPL